MRRNTSSIITSGPISGIIPFIFLHGSVLVRTLIKETLFLFIFRLLRRRAI